MHLKDKSIRNFKRTRKRSTHYLRYLCAYWLPLTACEAFMDGIQPFFVADAVADFSLEHHKQALGMLQIDVQ